MRAATGLALLAALAAVMFQLRPGLPELRRQVVDPARGRSSRPDLIDEAFRLAALRANSPATATLTDSSKGLRDYYLVTVVTPRKTRDLRFVGVLANFIPYYDRDDVLTLAGLMLLGFLAQYLAPGTTFRLCKPSLRNPLCIVTSAFFSQSIISTLLFCTQIINSGELVQRDLGRLPFLGLFFAATALGVATEFVTRRWPRPVGGVPASFAILLYATLCHPNVQYSFYGVNLSGFGLIAAHIGVIALQAQGTDSFLSQIGVYLSGMVTGLCTFLYFNERQAEALLSRVNIPVGEGKTPSSLIAPVICLHFLAVHMIANHIAP